MVTLEFFVPEKHLAQLGYNLDEEQQRFTTTVDQALENIEGRNGHEAFPVTILNDHAAAGFFVLDFGHDKLELTDNNNSVLVRSLSVNPELQGKGIGKTAMMQVDEFVKDNFKYCDEIVLAVNQKNDSAYHIYLKAGYIFDGKTRIGRSGPQYLMYKKL